MSGRKLSLAALGLALLGLALWLRTRDSPPPAEPPPAPHAAELALQATSPADALASQPRRAGVSGGPATAQRTRVTPERQQLRERVVRALQEREQRGAAAASVPVPSQRGGEEQGWWTRRAS